MSKDTTKQHITDCFNGLSRKYTLDQITVNMIAEAAGVSKSTFYRHFLDKYDVMNYNYKRVLDEIFSFNACKSWNELFLSILSFIEKDINRIRHAFLYLGTNSYEQYVFEYSFKRMNEKLIIYGCVYAVKDWLFGDKRVSRQELARQIDNAIPEEYKALL